MLIDNKTKNILILKFHFKPDQIYRLEKNIDLLAQTLGVIELLQGAAGKKDVQTFAKHLIGKIKTDLAYASSPERQFLKDARSQYYTFSK